MIRSASGDSRRRVRSDEAARTMGIGLHLHAPPPSGVERVLYTLHGYLIIHSIDCANEEPG